MTKIHALAIASLLSVACDRSSAPTQRSVPFAPPAPSAPAAPSAAAPADAAPARASDAPAAPANREVKITFDDDAIGAPPRALDALVGPWSVMDHDGARVLAIDGSQWRSGVPSPDLAEHAQHLFGDRAAELVAGVKGFASFPFALWSGDLPPGDVAISVRFYPIAGKVDQAAGIVFDAAADGSYWGVRANALEDNLLFFHVVKGARTVLAEVPKVKTATKAWHTLAIELRGKTLTALLDGQKQLERTLDAAPRGRIGLWSKADSHVLFDDLTIAPLASPAASPAASPPLVLVADAPLPGRAARFDYQDFDATNGHLVIAHMNDASVVVVNARDGSVAKVLPNIPTARGVAVASDVGRIFVTSAPNKLVIVDSRALTEIARVDTGKAPDGVGWDPQHKMVGVSDQGDGAISLLADAGSGARRQVPLGTETGNVVYDPSRSVFWITVVPAAPPDQLVAVDPITAKITTTLPLPGCAGAHGLRIHPDGKSALIACERNAKVVRIDLGGAHAIDIAPSGADPDVLAIDPGLGWLYVAAESGDLRVFDIGKPGLVTLDREHPGDASHSVAVDPATHRVFFPLLAGPKGTPVLRIMRPTGT